MNDRPFDYVVGTGGVGTGILFLLEGDHPLQKNESRPAFLTDFQDFCKLHIILHYVAKLVDRSVPIYPISRIGDDDAGLKVLQQMQDVGMDTRFVRTDPALKTLFSVCFQYPDGQGGNLTTSNSACSAVTAADIDAFFAWQAPDTRGLVLAAPEVSIETRLHLLRRGKAQGCFTAASILASEASYFVKHHLFGDLDLLAINSDEAKAILQAAQLEQSRDDFAEDCARYLTGLYPRLSVIITLGADGAICCSQGQIERIHAGKRQPVNTAGAGDCFLGVVLASLVRGIPLLQPMVQGIPLLQPMTAVDDVCTAPQVARIAAEIKIQDKDTIHFGINAATIRQEILDLGLGMSEPVRKMLGG